MALTGQLSDMSLAELIEFFCNQRKTGRLKIDYQRGHSVFFIREGELVDAKVGSLSGVEAVYFSLTLPNAAFDFSPDVQATRRTINEKWTQVVLEGLRRLDEGLAPTEVDAFGGFSPTEADLAQMFDQVEHLDDTHRPQKNSSKNGGAAKNADAKNSDAKGAGVKGADAGSAAAFAADASDAQAAPSAEPFSMMVESAGGGSSKKKFAVMAVAAAVVLACAAVAVPFIRRSGASASAPAAASAPQPATPAAPEPSAADSSTAAPDASPDAANAESPDAPADASEAARREALDRERRDRERRRREEAAKKNNDDSPEDSANNSATPKPLTPAPSGPKSVRVTVNYDEAGRVTQASVAGATPGAEAYGSTAVRIARGRRFPAGKPGSTVVTIPVN
jgi:TonB family protein